MCIIYIYIYNYIYIYIYIYIYTHTYIHIPGPEELARRLLGGDALAAEGLGGLGP